MAYGVFCFLPTSTLHPLQRESLILCDPTIDGAYRVETKKRFSERCTASYRSCLAIRIPGEVQEIRAIGTYHNRALHVHTMCCKQQPVPGTLWHSSRCYRNVHTNAARNPVIMVVCFPPKLVRAWERLRPRRLPSSVSIPFPPACLPEPRTCSGRYHMSRLKTRCA